MVEETASGLQIIKKQFGIVPGKEGDGIDTESVVLPHHKIADVVNQKELIEKMRKTTNGEFVYLEYAVPRSSEHYTPYALTYVYLTFFYSFSSSIPILGTIASIFPFHLFIGLSICRLFSV